MPRPNLAPALLLASLVAACDAQPAASRQPARAEAPEGTWTVLQVGGDVARIFRDGSYGTPHVFAPTNRALFEAYGFVVAQDRLFQLELNRRAARGRLAELLGPATLPSDRYVRTVGYTDAELDAMFAALPGEEREIHDAYRDGINRYLAEVVAPDPSRLPFEFHALGATPAPWTTRDSVAFGAFMVRRFGEIGGREPTNAALLARVGPGIFDDLRWLDDPEAPVTIPDLAFGPRQRPGAQAAPSGSPDAEDGRARAEEIWAALGVPTKLGSYAWVVSAARSAELAPMLYGGPQMGFSAPEVLHEVQLTGGDGFHAIGMAFAGSPPILIGRNAHVAWTSTTATGDNVDTYVEILCGGGAGTVFRGACVPFESRVETIAVRGGAAVQLPVLRTVHGPVVGTGAGVAYAQRRAHWMREMETGSAFFGFDRATSLEEFEAAVGKVVTSHNFLYVDRVGNIAYWQAGQVPLRPAGFDPRLPLPGDGSAEWPGGLVPTPRSINPPQGWLANWNNKPARGYPAADGDSFGKQGRLLEIARRLEGTAPISLDDMRDIPKDIARVKGSGRESRFLLPYLFRAVDAVPPVHPLAPAAQAILAAWDGSAIADAVTSTAAEPGEAIFGAWLGRALASTFGDELGSDLGAASHNTLVHVLDAATGGSPVPPSRDYLNGARWEAVLSASFDQALLGLSAAMGPVPELWTPPRNTTVLNHPIVGPVGAIPESNRSTYAQIVVAPQQGMTGESIFTLGQSGFIAATPTGGFALDPHFRDQLDPYRRFEYKPQRLYQNVQLKE